MFAALRSVAAAARVVAATASAPGLSTPIRVSGVALWMALFTLGGCSALPVGRVAGERFHPAPGSELELMRAIRVAEGDTRVFIQEGAAMTLGRVDQLRPHCNFELRRRAPQATEIAPGRYRVTGVRRGVDRVVELRPVMVAAAPMFDGALYGGPLFPSPPGEPGSGGGPLVQLDEAGGAPMLARYVRLDLESGASGGPWRFTCHGRYLELPEAEEPTLEEVRATLQGLVRLHLRKQ